MKNAGQQKKTISSWRSRNFCSKAHEYFLFVIICSKAKVDFLKPFRKFLFRNFLQPRAPKYFRGMPQNFSSKACLCVSFPTEIPNSSLFLVDFEILFNDTHARSSIFRSFLQKHIRALLCAITYYHAKFHTNKTIKMPWNFSLKIYLCHYLPK